MLLEHLVASSELKEENKDLIISCYVNYTNYIPTNEQLEMHAQ
jgi:hypothetical protein